VFEQVSHAGLAVTLVPRADQDGKIDGDDGGGAVREQQDAQAVVELVFRDTLYGDAFFGVAASRPRGRWARREDRQSRQPATAGGAALGSDSFRKLLQADKNEGLFQAYSRPW